MSRSRRLVGTSHRGLSGEGGVSGEGRRGGGREACRVELENPDMRAAPRGGKRQLPGGKRKESSYSFGQAQGSFGQAQLIVQRRSGKSVFRIEVKLRKSVECFRRSPENHGTHKNAPTRSSQATRARPPRQPFRQRGSSSYRIALILLISARCPC